MSALAAALAVTGAPHAEAAPLPVSARILRRLPGAVPAVQADSPWSEAGRTLLRIHLERALGRVPGIFAGEDIEDVHSMRVATRRMRAAWRVFGDGFDRDATRRHRAGLRDIGARLGAVRDLDVLIEILVAWGSRRGGHPRPGLQPLLGAWESERATRREALLVALASDWFAAFVRDYQVLLDTPGFAEVTMPPHQPRSVRTRMPAAIWGAYQAVWAFDGHLGDGDLATLHELRIAAKWLRYTLEFVRAPLEPAATTLIRRVVALQDHLGNQHDRFVAAGLARQMLLASSSLTGPQAKAIGRFVDHLDRSVEQAHRTLVSVWRPVVAPAYRRRLGVAIAQL